MSKIGFHYSSNNGLEKHWQSNVSLVLAGNVGGEIDRVKVVSQWSDLVVYRAWQYGGVGYSDKFEDYYARYGTNPAPLIDLYRSVFDALKDYKVTYQFFNETGLGIWDKYIEFNVNLIHRLDMLGETACVLNMFTGTPSGTRENIRETWIKARPLFKMIHDSYGRHYIGLHEYTGFPISACEPYFVGRYKWMLEDAGVDDLAVIINEFGYTDICNAQNQVGGYRGWLNKGITPEQLADDIYDTHQRVYEPDPHVIGTCYFCVGDSGGWENYDLTKEPRIIQRLKERMTPLENYAVLVSELNVRKTPSLAGVIVGKVIKGQVIQVSADWVEVSGYRWRKLSDGNWVAELNITTQERFIAPSQQNEIGTLLDEIETRLDRIRELVKG